MTDAPREDLIRMNGSFEVRADDDGRRTLLGYTAKFMERTEIHGWEGDFIEQISPKAFNRTIKNNRDSIKVLFNHGMDPQIGDKPLGKPKVMRTDEIGFWTETPLSRTSYNNDLIELLDDEALDGQSFRFSVIKDSWAEPEKRGGLPIRTLEEVRLMEFGPVTFPAYSATTAGVRSRESFDRWRQLPDEQRQQIASILGTSFEARGSGSEELAGSNADDSDAVAAAHHSARTRYLQWQARQRLA